MPFQHPNDMGEFRQIVMDNADKKVLVQVSATWCGPCSLIKDDLAAIAEEFAANYVFVYADVDKLEDVQELF